LPISARLSRSPGAGLSRSPVGPFFAVLLAPGGGLLGGLISEYRRAA
jgi:hypothetical protein